MDRIADYIAAVEDEDLRGILETLSRLVRDSVPGAEPGWAYGMPAYLYGGKPVAGIAAFRAHVGFYPMSGNLLAAHAPELTGFRWAKGSLQLTPGTGVPARLIAELLQERMTEIEDRRARS